MAQLSCSNARRADQLSRLRLRLPMLARALAAAGLFSAAPVIGAVITDAGNEPANDFLATATTTTAGNTFTGCISLLVVPPCAPDLFHQNLVGGDPEDFVEYIGLGSANTYRLSLSRLSPAATPMHFDLYNNGHVVVDSTVLLNTPGPSLINNLTGLTSLALGIHFTSSPIEGTAEGYTVTLTRTGGPSVPEPASVALVAAGLAGAFVARRKKRK